MCYTMMSKDVSIILYEAFDKLTSISNGKVFLASSVQLIHAMLILYESAQRPECFINSACVRRRLPSRSTLLKIPYKSNIEKLNIKAYYFLYIRSWYSMA